MKFYIGITDIDWFLFLKSHQPEDINFWKPSGLNHFKAIQPGSPFLFKLKSPINLIAGIGFFTSYSLLPIDFAWEVFRLGNGCESLHDFQLKIISYRSSLNTIDRNPNIGCIVLTNPIFFNKEDWISLPKNWSNNIVQGKTFDTIDADDKNYWQTIQTILIKYSSISNVNEPEDIPLYNQYFKNVRIGQGAFRVLVTEAYARRCAISGEKTLPVLEAAHIKPYSSGINTINNGLLLRSDLHRLFDSGYITITNQYCIEVSRKIKEEYENGKDYYKFHGKGLVNLPRFMRDFPDKEYLRWHSENVFKI